MYLVINASTQLLCKIESWMFWFGRSMELVEHSTMNGRSCLVTSSSSVTYIQPGNVARRRYPPLIICWEENYCGRQGCQLLHYCVNTSLEFSFLITRPPILVGQIFLQVCILLVLHLLPCFAWVHLSRAYYRVTYSPFSCCPYRFLRIGYAA